MAKPKDPSNVPPAVTVSGPAKHSNKQIEGVNSLSAEIESNINKPFEYGLQNALAPHEGEAYTPEDPSVCASTATEANASEKLGSGGPTDRKSVV